jgi:hypothetical protein
MRTMSKPKKAPQPIPEPAPSDERPIHLRTDAEFRSRLDQIVGWMKTDPAFRGLRLKLGREKAIRYAVGRLIASPPEHVGAERG